MVSRSSLLQAQSRGRSSASRALRRTASMLALMGGSIGLAALATPAQAQCVVGAPNTYVCSGQTDVSQVIVGTSPTVTTTAGFEVDTSANGNGVALSVSGTGLVTYTDANASPLTGGGVRFSATGNNGPTPGGLLITSDGEILADAANGLLLETLGAGDIDATWTADITNTNAGGVGVRAANVAGSGSIDLTVGDVTGAISGVVIDNLGSGTTQVTSTGVISGGLRNGVQITAGFPADDVVVEVNSVSGGERGISISHLGFVLGAETRVTATGDVSGGTMEGIYVGANGSGLVTVEAVNVSGGADGIYVRSGGADIVTTGTVVGAQNGIFAWSSIDGISVQANSATGGVAGISTYNEGSGATNIDVTGLVQGGQWGVYAESFRFQDIYIRNTGEIRSGPGAFATITADNATGVGGGRVELRNEGLIVGRISFITGFGLFENAGTWNAAGSQFQVNGPDAQFINTASGVVLAASAAGTREAADIGQVSLLRNSGRMSMQDGGAGDLIRAVATNTVFTAGSVLAVDIGGLESDIYRTPVFATLEPGAILSVDVTPAGLVLGHQYVVLEAVRGLTGEFVLEDEYLTAFTGLRLGYTATTAYVEYAQLRDLVEAALTPNQEGVAASLDLLGPGHTLTDAVLLLPDDAAAQSAFDQLSGEIHPSARAAIFEDSRLPRQAVLDRLSVDEDGPSAWGQVFGSWGESDGDDNVAGLDRDSRGLILGADLPLGDSLTLGVAVGFVDGDLSMPDRASTATTESVHGIVYAGGRFGRWRVATGIGYAQTTTETLREIAFPGFSAAPTADYDGSVLQAFWEGGYRFPIADGYLEPFANVSWISVETDSFQESLSPAALSARAADDDAALTTLGVRFQTPVAGPFSVRGTAGWRRDWGDTESVGVQAVYGGPGFTVLGVSRSENAAVAALEAQWRFSPAAVLTIAYDGVLGDQGNDHAVTGSFRFVF